MTTSEAAASTPRTGEIVSKAEGCMVALDSVETRAGKRVDVQGGAATYFSVAASFLTPTPVRLTVARPRCTQ